MTTCEQYLRELEESVEKRLSLPLEVREHLMQCSEESCQQALLEYDLLEAAIPLWQQTLPGIDFSERIIEEIQPDGSLDGSMATRSVVTPIAQQGKTRNSSAKQGALVGTISVLSLCLLLIVQHHSTGANNGDKQIATADNNQAEELLPPAHVGTDENLFTADATADVEAELRELGSVYGTWMQGASNRLTDTVTVVLLSDDQPKKQKKGWLSEISEQIEAPLESTLEFLKEQSETMKDGQSDYKSLHQKEYFGFLWSKSESFKPLFTFTLV